jgi:uncharacterized membrane protein YeiH
MFFGGAADSSAHAEIPAVLRAELYAVAALVGAGVVVIGTELRLPAAAVMLVGAALCFGLRLAAIYCGWHLPVARQVERPATQGREDDSAKDH